MIKVLVAYASKHQSTAEIAEAIGKTLRQRQGLEVDVREASTVKEIAEYGAVVLGSAVYVGQWQDAAADLLKNHEVELRHRAVWLFSSGPTGDGKAKELMQGWDFPEGLRLDAESVKPYDVAYFKGKIDPEKLSSTERTKLQENLKPTGDFRDWEAIHKWADRIGETLQILMLPE